MSEAPFSVEIDLYSGMPNPVYSITKKDAEFLLKKIKTSEKDFRVSANHNLGYRGCILKINNRKTLISNGGIFEMFGCNKKMKDKDNVLEIKILSLIKKHLHEKDIQSIKRSNKRLIF